jgi:hypothetical protein
MNVKTRAKYPAEEIVRRGEEIYGRLRPEVETDENVGKVIVIDIESGDYEMNEDHLTASDAVHARNPDGEFYATRVGYTTLDAMGSSLKRRQ